MNFLYFFFLYNEGNFFNIADDRASINVFAKLTGIIIGAC